MSRRREAGEWVRVRGRRAQVRAQRDEPWSCVRDCGDPECREWNAVLRDDDVVENHVCECEMEEP